MFTGDKSRLKFFNTVPGECDRLVRGIKRYDVFSDLEFRGRESLYVTNAVKRYLHENAGRYAHEIDEHWLREGLGRGVLGPPTQTSDRTGRWHATPDAGPGAAASSRHLEEAGKLASPSTGVC